MDLSTMPNADLDMLMAQVMAEQVKRRVLADPTAAVVAIQGGQVIDTKKRVAAKADKVAAPKPEKRVVKCCDCDREFGTTVGSTRCGKCAEKLPKVKCVACPRMDTDYGIVSRGGKCARCFGKVAEPQPPAGAGEGFGARVHPIMPKME